VPIDPPLKFQESLEFEDSVEDMESLVFVLDRLLEQISARLVSRSLATDELRLTLALEIHEDRDVKSNLRRSASSCQILRATLKWYTARCAAHRNGATV
jgi:hypothetical protein